MTVIPLAKRIEFRATWLLPAALCLILILYAGRFTYAQSYWQSDQEAIQATASRDETTPIVTSPLVQSTESAPESNETSISHDDNACQECGTESDEAQQAHQALQKKVASAHKPLFYDNDFTYRCDPELNRCWLGDRLKRRSPFGVGCFDLGGQYRARAQFENNHRGLGLTGNDDDFLLHRLRLFGNWQITPDIRLYGEMIDADSNYEGFAPRAIEVNRTDLLNGFVDARLLSRGERDLTLRVGRQELLYGEQRVVSPLDWANTRRTFDGAKLMWSNATWNIDAFWTHPVFPVDHSFDSPNRDQEFMGIWATHQACSGRTTDLYYLRYLNGSGNNRFEFDTLGFRAKGERRSLLWELQAAIQLGENTDGSDHSAGMATLGLGKKFKNARWQPTAWLFYDYASGDNDLGAGNGYHHLFPLAHKYFGFMDLFGRRNIEDVNLLLTMQPAKKLSLLVWYHYMFLATQSDSPYSVIMTPFNGANLPGSPDLGHEIDLLATWSVTARQKLVLGYSRFYSGRYFSSTAGVPFNGDANFYYAQWELNF